VWSRFPCQQRLNAGQSVLSQSGNATEKGKAANIRRKKSICAGLTKKMTASNILLSQRASLGKKQKKTRLPTQYYTHTQNAQPSPKKEECIVCVCVCVCGCV